MLMMMFFKSNKKRLYVSLFLNVVLMLVLIYVSCLKTDICYQALSKIGLVDYVVVKERHRIELRCLKGWANCLAKQHINMDAVFYGNSIIYESNFQFLFPDLKICNLGCNRDDLDDLLYRSFIIKNVHPRKIFVLGGINSIINNSLGNFDRKYNALVETIMKQNPTSQIYLQSLLPVNIEMDIGSRYVNCQEKIKEANDIIRNISKNKGCIYVDLYSAYQVNDSLPKKYSRDGLHLYPEAYAIWSRVISSYLVE